MIYVTYLMPSYLLSLLLKCTHHRIYPPHLMGVVEHCHGENMHAQMALLLGTIGYRRFLHEIKPQ